MARDPRYDILFEPVRIGPVVAPNRFYQVPHCSGMPHLVPRGYAAMREAKAEGGWGVVTTEACSIHPTSDAKPTPEDHLWDDGDIVDLAFMVERVKRHGALAAVEILHHGAAVANRFSREVPISPRGGRLLRHKDPVQARRMDRDDIRELRRWHRAAALRAKRAGFDIVYVYAGHEVSLPLQFIWRRFNDRTDEYGGSLENRVRLLRELLEDTREAVGDRCAVALRWTVEELLGPGGITRDGEGREVVALLAELPDLWDVTVSAWANDSTTARFADEGWQTEYTSFVKQLTSRPVVGTGRFTSPDLMASLVRRGALDLIGAARPSIADPFLPRKIERGDVDDIRECIGCNMCVTGNNTAVPIRCTQNPTMGEEWRRGWHPESIPSASSPRHVLVVGAGPTGLEAARMLGERGHRVTLAEARKELGGRLLWETRLPGLATWMRVRDWRRTRLLRLDNVEVFLDSRLGPDDVLGLGVDHVVVATGSRWRADGVGQARLDAVPGWETADVLTPETASHPVAANGPVLVYDDDHFYLGGCLAEKLALEGHAVTLVTPAAEASSWTHATLEQGKIQRRLIECGVAILAHRLLAGLRPGEADLACVFTGRTVTIPAARIVMVTERIPTDELYQALRRDARLAGSSVRSLVRIGDCLAPATIAHAVFAGHRLGRELDEGPRAFARERVGAATE